MAKIKLELTLIAPPAAKLEPRILLEAPKNSVLQNCLKLANPGNKNGPGLT